MNSNNFMKLEELITYYVRKELKAAMGATLDELLEIMRNDVSS